jgi:PAS domain S-box-containing protein
MESRLRSGSGAILDAEAPESGRQKLPQMRAPIEQLVDSNIIGILFAKPEGPIMYANDEFLRMVGYSREDLEAGRMDWRKMTPMEWNFATREAARQIQETRKAAPFEKEFFRKDGSRAGYRRNCWAVHAGSGRAVFRIGSHGAEADRTRPGPVDDRTIRDAGFDGGRHFWVGHGWLLHVYQSGGVADVGLYGGGVPGTEHA